jgi:dynein heavy chain, axonemal
MKISEKASKEHGLKKMLVKMQSEWVGMEIVLQSWKESDVQILQGEALEEIQALLDEHIITAQTIRSNPNVT